LSNLSVFTTETLCHDAIIWQQAADKVRQLANCIILSVKSQRNFEVDAELVDRISSDARKHGSLFVAECHFSFVATAGRRLDVRRVVPDSWSNVEADAAVEVESAKVFWAYGIADLRWRQQQDVGSSSWWWEEHLTAVWVVVGVTDKDVVTRSFRQQFSKRVANLEWYADGEVVAVEDVTNPATPEVALYWQLAMQTTQLP